MPAVEIIDLRQREDRRGRPERVAPPGHDPGTRRRRAGHPALEPARVSHVRPLPAVRPGGQVPRVRRGGDVPQRAAHLDLPHLRRRARLPAGLPGLRRTGLALRRHRHRAARARDPARRFPTSSRGGWTRTRCARPAATSRCLSAFKAGEVRILLGTQMIAKGLDFPNVTLGGGGQRRHRAAPARLPRRRADLSARGAGGRTHRAGRRPGRVLVQTYSPDHPAIRSASTARLSRASRRTSCPSGKNMACPRTAGSVRLIARGAGGIGGFRLHEGPGGGVSPGGRARRSASWGRPRPPSSRSATSIDSTSSCAVPTPGRSRRWRTRVPARHPAPHGIELAIDVDPITML